VASNSQLGRTGQKPKRTRTQSTALGAAPQQGGTEMSKLAHEIETLRKEAAERAVTFLYNAIENASMYDLKVFDLMQMFANEA
jgi:hypothetical protein